MIGPVRPEGQWWGDWQRVGEEERVRLLSDIRSQVRGDLPATTEVSRRFLSCYPRHALLRMVLPGEYGPRDSYAFYAPGQVYPLTWWHSAISAFDEVGLEIKGVEQAEEYLRFATWAQITPYGRGLIVEDRSQLVFREGASLSEEDERRLSEMIRPLTQVGNQPDDLAGSYRFEGSLLWGDGLLISAEFLVGRLQYAGPDSGIQKPGWRFFERDEPARMTLPLVEERVGESDRYFVLVKETSLSAEDFVRRLRAGPVSQVRVTEQVRLRDAVFSNPVVISQVTFDYGIVFDGARFEKGLTLEQCVVEGQLSLREAKVEGSLSALGLWFHRGGKHWALGSLNKLTRWGSNRVDLEASGLEVGGSAFFEGLRARNMVDFSRATIEGDLRLGGARIGRTRGSSKKPVEDVLLRLDGARVQGDLDLVYTRTAQYELPEGDEEYELPGGDEGVGGVGDDGIVPVHAKPLSVVHGTIQANRLQVDGQLEMPGLRCDGDMWFGASTVGADLNAGAHGPSRVLVVLGGVWLNNCDVGGDVLLQGMQVGGGLQVFSSRIEGSVYARTTGYAAGRVPRVRVGGQVDFSGSSVHDVDFEGFDLGSLRIVTGEIGRLTLQPGIAEWDDDGAEDPKERRVRQIALRVGKLDLFDLTVAKRIGIRAEISGDADLGNIDCGGDLEFWSDRVTDSALEEALEHGEQWAPGAPIRQFDLHTVVNGDLKCTGLRIGGRLVLTNVDAKGRILFKNCQVEQDLHCPSMGPDPESKESRTKTECRHLDLELTRCGGDVDLSGLRVSGDDGSVHARQLQVTGRILFARPLAEHADQLDVISADPEKRVQALVSKDLDLSVAEAAQLVLVGSSFGGKVNLERGRFRRLDIVEPWRFTSGHNLTDIHVDRWQIADEHLRTFLRASEPFARATYVEIEKVLRNKAQDAEADRVYRAMRARAIEQAKKDWGLRREAQKRNKRQVRRESLAAITSSFYRWLLRWDSAQDATGTEGGEPESAPVGDGSTRGGAGSDFMRGILAGMRGALKDALEARGVGTEPMAGPERPGAGSVEEGAEEAPGGEKQKVDPVLDRGLTREAWWMRAAAPVSYVLRTTGSTVQGWVYGWGTLYWAPLLVCSIVLVPLSLALLSTPRNVAPTPELLAASGLSLEGASPSDLGAEWGKSDGLWLAVRYHIPVVPLSAREDYRPARRPAELDVPRLGTVRFVFSAESYAFVIYLLNWILWPLFLVGLARRIVRETT